MFYVFCFLNCDSSLTDRRLHVMSKLKSGHLNMCIHVVGFISLAPPFPVLRRTVQRPGHASVLFLYYGKFFFLSFVITHQRLTPSVTFHFGYRFCSVSAVSGCRASQYKYPVSHSRKQEEVRSPDRNFDKSPFGQLQIKCAHISAVKDRSQKKQCFTFSYVNQHCKCNQNHLCAQKQIGNQ